MPVSFGNSEAETNNSPQEARAMSNCRIFSALLRRGIMYYYGVPTATASSRTGEGEVELHWKCILGGLSYE